MTRRLLPLLLLVLLSSCATIFSKKTYEMEVRSNTYTKVKVYDSVFDLPAKIEVKRSKENLSIAFISDTVSKNHFIKASVSPKYLFGNLSFVHFAPVGYLIDLTTQKRFYYGNSILINANDTVTEINTQVTTNYKGFKKRVRNYFTKDFDTNKGQLNVIVSVPWINSFHFKPIGESAQNNTGFLGLSTGLEYFYHEKRFVGLYGSFTIDSEVPVFAPISYDGEHQFLRSYAVGLTHNHKLNRFTVGYGLNYSKNTWQLKNNEYDPLEEGSRMPQSKSNHSLGLITNSYFQFGKRLFVGINYKPSLIAFNANSKLHYEHVISLDFVWKFKIKG